MDAYVMRELANIATRDAQGIQLPGHLKVTAQGTPSGSVSVAAGGAVIRNFQASGQSYVGRVASATTVPISPTSGTSRSEMIIAYVRDPDFSPWQPYTLPNDILFGPYFFVDHVACSASATTAAQVVSYSAVELARIDIPANTTNITNAMIVDLRSLAQPRSGTAKAVQGGPGTQDNLTISQTTWRNWPSNSLGVTIPTWCTHLFGSIRLLQVQADAAGDFQSRINVGGITGTGTNFDYNGNAGTTAGYVEGIPFEIFADINVQSLQGQTVTVKPEAQRVAVNNTGNIWLTSRQQVVYDLFFAERTV